MFLKSTSSQTLQLLNKAIPVSLAAARGGHCKCHCYWAAVDNGDLWIPAGPPTQTWAILLLEDESCACSFLKIVAVGLATAD